MPDYNVKGYFAQYFASQLFTREWAQPVDEPHRVFRATSEVRDSSGNLLVTAYALERPDGQWSLLLVNKDHEEGHNVRIAFADSEGKRKQFLAGQVDRITFGASEYQWHANGANGYAKPDGPAARSTVEGSPTDLVLASEGVDHRAPRQDQRLNRVTGDSNSCAVCAPMRMKRRTAVTGEVGTAAPRAGICALRRRGPTCGPSSLPIFMRRVRILVELACPQNRARSFCRPLRGTSAGNRAALAIDGHGMPHVSVSITTDPKRQQDQLVGRNNQGRYCS